MKITFPAFIIVSSSLVTALCALAPRASAAPASTTTTLAITSGGNAIASGGTVASGSVVTLTAMVAAGSKAVTVGQVNFCNASATYCTDIYLLGTAQLTSAGTAVFRFIPGIGSHRYKAVFRGTPNSTQAYAASTSDTVTLTVTGTSPTTTAIAPSGGAGNYSLTATVTGHINAPSLPAPAGSVSFLDTADNNLSLGTATLGPGAAAAVSFLNSSNPTPGLDPLGLAVGDFNGDGIPDLVVTTASAETVAIFLGNGDGTFSAAGLVPIAGPDAQQVVVGDFNGDGKADIALLFADINLVQVLLGNGDGTFTVMPAIPVPNPEGFLFATADFNGDGKADLVLANTATNTLTILLGNGDGTFSAAAATPAMNGLPQAVAVGDFNGDGIPDLAVAIDIDQIGVPGSVAILLGNGDGTFTLKAESFVTGDSPSSIVVGDFNGDGILDLAVANGYDNTLYPGTVTVLLGNGDGTFTPTKVSPVTGFIPNSIAVGDFNGDGIADLATANEGGMATVLLGNGDGTFATGLSPAAGGSPCFITAGDFNGDGLTDLAVSDCYTPSGSLSTVSVLLSQLTRTATATSTGISPVGVGIHLVAASYPGNSTYSSSVSATTGLTANGFVISGTAVTVLPGASTGNTSTITVTPSGGFTGLVMLTAAITSSPAGVVNPPTFSFGATSPVSVTGIPAGVATLTITTYAAAGCGQARNSSPEFPWYRTGGAVLACLFFFCLPARQRRWRAMLGIALFLVILSTGVEACGGRAANGVCLAISPATTVGNYTVTVTGTSGAITEQGAITLTVQ